MFLFLVQPGLAAVKDSNRTDSCLSLVRLGPPSESVRLLCKKGFLIGYDTARRIPLWTEEVLRRSKPQITSQRPSAAFREDLQLPIGTRSSPSDYTGTGYDRGHLAAAGNHVSDAEELSDTYLLSNIAPQVGNGFNRTVWRELEEEVRNWAQCVDHLYVYTGVYFGVDQPLNKTIGANKVHVPDGFFKVLYSPDHRIALAFIADNKPHIGATITQFLTSIDAVERLSGLDFLRRLPDEVEATIESRTPKDVWQIEKSTPCKVVPSE
jgi:endonuclease G